MTVLINHPDTLAQVLARELNDWRARLTALDKAIAAQQVERDMLAQKIAAAEVLLGKAAAPPEEEEGGRRSLGDVVESLMTDGRVRAANDIRRALIAQGEDPRRVSTHTGYFYSTLTRLVLRGVLSKEGRGYRYVPPAERQAAAG